MKDAYWIGNPTETKLAIVPRPRGGDWLETDLANLKREGIDILISMLTREEEIELGLEHERELAESIGMAFYSYPIPDRSIPSDMSGFRRFITDIANVIDQRKKAGAHCRGCIGRATIMTASILIAKNWSPERALLEIEAARGCQIPDTPAQQHWIEHFAL
jgi:protein-tyrosine phosphatase